jgi:hypothetical protein
MTITLLHDWPALALALLFVAYALALGAGHRLRAALWGIGLTGIFGLAVTGLDGVPLILAALAALALGWALSRPQPPAREHAQVERVGHAHGGLSWLLVAGVIAAIIWLIHA